ncbi:hypothetical protein HHK36_015205 [Tetracentron sinense]|uniref:Peptidase metallopeptidase domain-containing protein n=1 Tax=Tetracentron sinense TaxID=13715 RepID=A0A834Z4K2_TETSI|nr:hypothetical protein HHK36_015205 [Tetracentron sinense]
MTFHRLVTAILLSLFSTSVTGLPHFFPNITSIPPSFLPNATTGAWNAFHNFAGCHPGEKVDGLAKLKQYFNRFGYIPNSPSNFSDDFDDALESALKEYQLNFNLNTSGVLDESTLQQIVRPRCGVADIINGTSTMNSGKAASLTTGHFHTVGHYTFFPGTPKWPSSNLDLTYAFFPGNQLTDSVKAIFSRAFDRWAAVTPLTFTETASFSSADLKIGFFSGDHGDGEPFDGQMGTLAHAFSPTNGHFHLDGDENWVLDGDSSSLTSSSTSAIDLESVAVHEIGHLLGLGHSSVEESIMFPTISSGSKKIVLASDDIQGIQVLYGGNPNSNSSSTTTTGEERGTSDSGAYSVGPWWGLSIVIAAVSGLLLL